MKTVSEIIAEVKAAFPGAWCHKDLGWMGPRAAEAEVLERDLRAAAGLGARKDAPRFATGKPVEIARGGGSTPWKYRND